MIANRADCPANSAAVHAITANAAKGADKSFDVIVGRTSDCATVCADGQFPDAFHRCSKAGREPQGRKGQAGHQSKEGDVRKITIIGAGHAGLQLGTGLLKAGHAVVIVTNRSADEVRSGRITSSQSMYNMAVGIERDFGMAFWDEHCPPIEGMHIRAGLDADRIMVDFRMRMPPGQSVDQRLKFPRWMEEFERLGGRLRIEDTNLDRLEEIAASSDLTIVAAGKGEIGKLFARDAARCTFDAPQRITALTYLHGVRPREDFGAININVHPGAGEMVHFPALTLSGACDIVNLECVPGGPMDVWSGIDTPARHLEATLDLIHSHFPWDAHRFADARLTDDLGVLAGPVTPTVRRPVGFLPSGQPVLALGDVFLLNDPMTGQGSNNASKCAALYLQAIEARGDLPFDTYWIAQLTERAWDETKWSARLTNTMLAPPAHVLGILAAAAERPGLAQQIAACFNDPRTMGWYVDPVLANRVIAETTVTEQAA